MKYILDNNGRIIACGNLTNGIEEENIPFGMHDYYCWKKDIETGE